MTDAPITNFLTNGGSRHFLSLPETIYPEDLVKRINSHTDLRVTNFIYSVPESWIDFEFRARQFTINTQFGEYWFFVSDPECPIDILTDLRERVIRIMV